MEEIWMRIILLLVQWLIKMLEKGDTEEAVKLAQNIITISDKTLA